MFGAPTEAVAAGAVGGMLQAGAPLEYLTVRELVTLVASVYPRPLPVDEAMRLAGVTEFAGRRTNKLSGGQAQRVRFALGWCQPRLLVLDEPTAAVDVEGRRAFWAAMRAVAAEGRTVLFATHYLEEADAYADRIVVMARGRIVADGPATEIKAKAGGRIIRATIPVAYLAGRGDTAALAALPGVTNAERHGEAVILTCADSDLTLRALLEPVSPRPATSRWRAPGSRRR